MSRVARHITASSLLIILLINGLGFYVFYALELKRIHDSSRELIKILPDAQLTRIILSLEEYKDSKVGADELKLDEKMYDVARLEHKADSVIVYAMHDEEEENILSFVGTIISQPEFDHSRVPASVIQFLNVSYLLSVHALSFDAYNASSVNHHTLYHFAIAGALTRQDVPPPRRLSA